MDPETRVLHRANGEYFVTPTVHRSDRITGCDRRMDAFALANTEHLHSKLC